MHRLLLLVVLLLTSWISAAAAPVCVPGTVVSIQDTTCTIGDTTFSFHSVGSTFGVADVFFTPVSLGPDAVGFTLTTQSHYLPNGTTTILGQFRLDYSVVVTDPARLIVGTTVTALDPIAVQNGGVATALATSVLDNFSPHPCYTLAHANSGVSYLPGVLSGAQYSALSTPCTEITFASALLGLEANDGGSASLYGGTFIINESSAIVSEPVSLFVFVSGLALLSRNMRRRRL